MLEDDKLKLLTLHKPRMKKVFSNAVPLASLMDVLPSSPEDCPKQFLNAAYPNGFVAGTPVTKAMDYICRLVATYPCRRRGKVAAELKSELGSPVTKTLTRFAAVAKAFSHPMVEPREKEELPGLKLLRPEAAAVSESSVPTHAKQLALMDRQPDASAEAVEEATQAEAPSVTVEKLKEALNTQKAAESHAKKGQKMTPRKENAKKREKTADSKESQVTAVKKKAGWQRACASKACFSV